MSHPSKPRIALLSLSLLTVVAVAVGCGGDDAGEASITNNVVDDGDHDAGNAGSGDAGWSEGQNNGGNNATNNAGASDAGAENNATNNDAVVPPYDDCAIVAAPADSMAATSAALQEAFLDVQPGQVVCLVDGVYPIDVELSVDVADVEIRGQSQDGTILDFSRQQQGANGILATSDGFTIASLTVRDTPGDGIRTTGVQGVTFRDITVEWSGEPRSTNGAYGLYPVQSQDVLIEGCKVRGASDAGIYVGQSQRIVVRHNEAWDNVAGIEIENSTDAEVHDNYAHDNTGGLLVFNLPSPPIQGGERAKVHHNRIEDNNRDNFAAAGNIVAQVPPGTGILVLASDDNEFHDNEIRGNDSLGIGIVSYQTLGLSWDNPDFDPYSEGNYVHDNLFVDNGTAPEGILLVVAGQAGLSSLEPMLWDGWVDPARDESTDGPLRNCFHGNVDGNGDPAAFRMINAPEGFAAQSTDLGDNACQGVELPSITLPQEQE